MNTHRGGVSARSAGHQGTEEIGDGRGAKYRRIAVSKTRSKYSIHATARLSAQKPPPLPRLPRPKRDIAGAGSRGKVFQNLSAPVITMASTSTPSLYIRNEAATSPPHAQTLDQTNPTLLVSWWCTIFSAVIILIRIGGRWVRTERLFLEDKMMGLAIVPLFIRMGCVHVILRNGTNNVMLANLTDEDVANRMLGSKLVLVARIFYAML